MKKIRKAVIPAAGPRLALAFALPALPRLALSGRPTIRSAAWASALTGRADFNDLLKGQDL